MIFSLAPFRPGTVAAAILCFAAALPGTAQSAALGNISGVVRDTAGAVIPNAQVVITNLNTGATRSIATNQEGHYAFTFLQPGNYEVVLGGDSFGKVDRKNVPVDVGDTATVDAVLPAASVDTTVVVTGQAPLLDTDKVEVSQTVSSELVSNLPVNGRRWDNFVLLTPNVAPDGNTGLISYRGVSGLYNSNLVDGANNNQAFFSEARGRSIGAPYVFSLDSIKEFTSTNAAYSAEFGQAAGGVINAITKSGTNKFHGDVFEYYRTPGLNAIDPITKPNKPNRVQHQYGGSIGGPVLKDKLFFFFTYDGYRRNSPIVYLTGYNTATQKLSDLAGLCDQRTSGYINRTPAPTAANPTPAPVIYPSTIAGITPAQCNAVLSFVNTKLLGSYAHNIKQDILFPRLDYQLNQSNHISLSANLENFKQPNGYNGATTVFNGSVTQNGTSAFHERFFVANWESVLSPHYVNVIHTQYSRDLETASTNTGGPANSVTGLFAYGETNALPRGAFPDEYRYQFTDIVSTTRGKHSIKVGGDVNVIHEKIQNLFQGDGIFNYNTGVTEFNFVNYLQDVYQVNGGRHYSGFTQVNDPITHVGADDFYNPDYDIFAEDAWKIHPRLLLSLGARYDLQVVPQPEKPNVSSPVAALYTSTILDFKKMIQPRVGFSWNPQQGTVVRGGYGIFYGLNSNSTNYTIRRENGVYQQQYNVSPTVNPNAPYVGAGAGCTPAPGTTRCFQQSGAYGATAPQGGIPLFLPPGPAPINQVTGAPITPVNTGATVNPGSISARGLDPRFQNPVSHSFDLTVEQELPFHSTFSIAYVGNRAQHLPIFVDTNVDPASAVVHTYVFTPANGQNVNIDVPYYTARLSPNTGALLTGFSDVNSWYHSAVFSVHKPFSNGIEVLANYTWAKAMDGGQISGVNGTFNGTDTPLDPFARGSRRGRSAEYSRSDLDQRGRFVGSIVAAPTVDRFIDNSLVRYALNGFTMAGTVTAQTGFPITGNLQNSPFSAIGDGGLSGAALSLFNSGTPGRVPDQIARRNSFKGPGVHNIDARLSRDFAIHESVKLQLLVEAFNVFNHKNVLSVANTLYRYLPVGAGCSFGSTSPGLASGCIVPLTSSTTPFGTPQSTSSILYGPRQFQLSGKLFF